jgi:hypothetical protein
MAPQSVRQQHDEYRNRLEMYCVLFFVSAALLILTPAVLLGSGVALLAIVLVGVCFAVLGIASYLAAIASASGYCAALKQMMKSPSPVDDDSSGNLSL